MTPLFDCALHFRFLQKATESMFEMGQASMAASLAYQKRLLDEMSPEKLQPPAPPPLASAAWAGAWMPWLGDWTPANRAPPPPPPQPDLMQSWLAMSNACSAFWATGQAATAATRTLPMTTPMISPISMLPPAVQAFWGVTPFTVYQGPMMAMMLSYGVPYAVAAPTARASTSAMDAADAACTQWRLVFGSAEGQKSLARNVSGAGAHWPTYLH